LWSAFLLSQDRQFGMATIEENEGGWGRKEEVIGDNGSDIAEVPWNEVDQNLGEWNEPDIPC